MKIWLWFETYRLPLKFSSFPFIYQSTDGSGTPFGGVQFKTTGPPTKATVSFGINLKSSRNTKVFKGNEIEKKSKLERQVRVGKIVQIKRENVDNGTN